MGRPRTKSSKASPVTKFSHRIFAPSLAHMRISVDRRTPVANNNSGDLFGSFSEEKDN